MEKELKKDFISEIKKIRLDIKKGRKLEFKNKDEMNSYLKRL